MYQLVFDKKATHFFNKLEKQTKNRIWSKLQQCKENPFRFLESLKEIGCFKLRVGEYRLLISVNTFAKTLTILKAGHRKNIYKD